VSGANAAGADSDVILVGTSSANGAGSVTRPKTTTKMTGSSLASSAEKASAAAAANAAALNLELRKQVESLKLSKEQTETKVRSESNWTDHILC
jgi:hypothetical protein